MKILWEKVYDNDIDSISEIEEYSFIDPWTKNMFLESMKSEYFFINKLTLGGKTIGFMCYYIVAQNEAHIASIAVDKQYRRQGFAEKIFEYFFKDTKMHGINNITLEVRESNVVAINLYLKIGFQNVGIRPKYYQNGENAIIMWLKR